MVHTPLDKPCHSGGKVSHLKTVAAWTAPDTSICVTEGVCQKKHVSMKCIHSISELGSEHA